MSVPGPSVLQGPFGQQALRTPTILKGWQSFSPGLRGTSYPGVVGQTSPTLKGLHRSGKTPVVVLPRFTQRGLGFAIPLYSQALLGSDRLRETLAFPSQILATLPLPLVLRPAAGCRKQNHRARRN